MSTVKIEFRPNAQREGETHTETPSTGKVHGRASASAILGFAPQAKRNSSPGVVEAKPANQVDRLNDLKPHALARALADMTDQEVKVLLPRLDTQKVEDGIQTLEKDERTRLMKIREDLAVSQGRSRGTQAVAFGGEVDASRERRLDLEQARSRI